MRVLRLRSITTILILVIGLNACEPREPKPTSTPSPTGTIAPTSTALTITATSLSNGNGAGLPAGSSTSYALTLNYPTDKLPQSVDWATEKVPAGITATIVGGAAPWQGRLVITPDGTLAVGDYTLDVIAKTEIQSPRVTVAFKVTACTETTSGSSTTAINSNLVELITAGKPAVEHGLLVPVQICGSKHLSVKLTSATAEDGSAMTTLPTFYIFRSEVWPAPDDIIAHGLAELFNVQVPMIAQADNTGLLETDVGAGLYLLIFEHDRFGATLTPPTMPANVTYTLTLR